MSVLAATVRRATYASLTHEQRRVAIAKDARAQAVSANLQVLSCHGYITLRSEEQIALLQAKLDARPAEPLPEDDDLTAHCQVCALGGLFLASARLFDQLPVAEINQKLVEVPVDEQLAAQMDSGRVFGRGVNVVPYASLFASLQGAFSVESIRRIEYAFEGRRYDAEPIEFLEAPYVSQAERTAVNMLACKATIQFYNRYEDDLSCFIAICDNIIENGDFIVPFDAGAALADYRLNQSTTVNRGRQSQLPTEV